jgi:Activator of Hsp90 ATPase homolog 1-like protein
MDFRNLVLEIEQQIEIKAPIEKSFEGLVRQLTDHNVIPLKLERFPGGRWFRDLGDGVGHLWGFVQVIKPPTLLEIHGPLFMSYPVVGHLQFRLAEVPGGTKVTLRHRAVGLIEDAHRQGVEQGWRKILSGIQDEVT